MIEDPPASAAVTSSAVATPAVTMPLAALLAIKWAPGMRTPGERTPGEPAVVPVVSAGMFVSSLMVTVVVMTHRVVVSLETGPEWRR